MRLKMVGEVTMKLSEQIANTCCGVLADKQEMVDKAVDLEYMISVLRVTVEELNEQLELYENE